MIDICITFNCTICSTFGSMVARSTRNSDVLGSRLEQCFIFTVINDQARIFLSLEVSLHSIYIQRFPGISVSSIHIMRYIPYYF